MSASGRRLGRPQAIAVDVAVVVVFAVLGRMSHDGGMSPAGLVGTTMPFLLGLAAGWALLGLPQLGRLVGAGGTAPYLRWRFGAALAVLTATVGMLARRFVWDDGTAVAFVIVTVAFLGAGLTGWRLVVNDRR